MNGSQSTAARGLRLAALITAALCVLGLAAGAFVLSYPGARDTALTAGVAASLARIYPGIFDAVLLVAFAAAFSLRGVLRGYAWLVMVVVIAAVAAADVVHAISVTLPRRQLEVTAAIVPWVVLLIGFTLLYAIARQGWSAWRAAGAARLAPAAEVRPAGQADPPAAGPGDAGNGTVKVPLSALLAGKPGPATVRDQDAAQPAMLPESLPAGAPGGRDEPSDADAEPVEPAAHFGRLHSSAAPPLA